MPKCFRTVSFSPVLTAFCGGRHRRRHAQFMLSISPSIALAVVVSYSAVAFHGSLYCKPDVRYVQKQSETRGEQNLTHE